MRKSLFSMNISDIKIRYINCRDIDKREILKESERERGGGTVLQRIVLGAVGGRQWAGGDQ